MKYQVMYKGKKIAIVNSVTEELAKEEVKKDLILYDYEAEEIRKRKNWETYHECPACSYSTTLVEKTEEKYKKLTNKEHELLTAGKLQPKPIKITIKYWVCKRCSKKWNENMKEKKNAKIS